MSGTGLPLGLERDLGAVGVAGAAELSTEEAEE